MQERQEDAIFRQTAAKFVTEKIMGAHNFNFPPKFSQNGFSAPNFAFWMQIFHQEEYFLTAKNLGRGCNCPLLPLP